jgi:ATP-binding cassette subfamily B protein
LDGRELEELNISWLRSQMSVVTQEAGLFDYSIEENVRMGRPDATYAEIVNACKAANAHGFVTQLPQVRPQF